MFLSYFEKKSDHFVYDLFASLWSCSLEHIKRGSNLPEVFVLMYIVREIWILQNIILWLNHALTAEKINGKVWVKPYFLFFLKFFKKVFILLQTLKLLLVENAHLILLLRFNLCFFMLGSPEGFDLHVRLPCFLPFYVISPLIIRFDLKFRNMFRRITTSLLCYSILVFENTTANTFVVQLGVSIL